MRVLWLNFYRKSSSNRHRLGGGDEGGKLGSVAEGDDLASILGHLLQHEAHLLVGQATVLELSLRQRGQELGVGPAEADAIVVRGRLADLLVSRLVLLIDADQSLDRPHGVGGELGLDEEEGVFFGGVHREHTMAHDLKKFKENQP